MSPLDAQRAPSTHLPLQSFLASTHIIDHNDESIRTLAIELAGNDRPLAIAARCFNWVRDNIRHSMDFGDRRVTLRASEVLGEGTGLCYAKSHLLAALLRANRIPCGLVYQRLAVDDSATSFCLHGLNAVWLEQFGWYRIDARGNREGISTAFEPPTEHLAFPVRQPGEATMDRIFADPLPVVVSTLSKHRDLAELRQHLPDYPPDESRL